MSEEPDRPFPRRAALLFAAGLVILVIALFTSNLTIRTLVFWWYASDYVRTELVVTEFSPHGKNPLVFGTIAATGEEIHTSILPTELFRHDTPDAVVGHLRSRDEALGMHIQVWYCPRRHSLFGDPRVMYVSEYGALPSTREALVTLGINVAIGWLGVFNVRRALRISRAAGC